jgi:hypothetical protein
MSREAIKLLNEAISYHGDYAYDFIIKKINEARVLFETESNPISLKVGEMPNRPVGAVEYAQAQAKEIDRLKAILTFKTQELLSMAVLYEQLEAKDEAFTDIVQREKKWVKQYLDIVRFTDDNPEAKRLTEKLKHEGTKIQRIAEQALKNSQSKIENQK